MDASLKKTLDLIEESAIKLKISEKGKSLLFVVRDYIDAGEHESAIRVLHQIDEIYFEEYMYTQCAQDEKLADVVATLIEVLGLGFWILVKPKQFLC